MKMNNKKATKRALLTSVMALAMCVVMLIGTTFAWFTDTATANVNRIQSGKLDVDIVNEAGRSLEGQTLNFVNNVGSADILWEPGVTFLTEGFRIANKGNLALKYTMSITGATGNAKLLEVIDFELVSAADMADAVTAPGTALTAFTGNLLPNKTAPETELYFLRGHMAETANNDYQNLTLNGIGITVYATQLNSEYDSSTNTYDENAGADTKFYSLADFNALTEIPAGVKNVYVDIGNVSLKEKGMTIGNYRISDQYMWVQNDTDAPEGFVATERTNRNTTAYRTYKDGITVHVLGSLTMENYSNNDFSGIPTLCFQLPEKSTVILENMTLNGSVSISGVYHYMYAGTDGEEDRTMPGYTNDWYATPLMIENIQLSNCTINGQWFGNGNVAKNVEINGCTFNDYNNVDNNNWANPIWWKNAGKTNLTVTNCTVTSTRPMKVGEGGIGSVTFTNNSFTMLAGDKYTAQDSDKVKNTALCFGNTINGDVVISGNTVNAGATALISLLDASMTMPAGKTFTVSGNTLNGVPTFVKWKDSAAINPSFVG